MTGRGRVKQGTPIRERLDKFTDRSGDCWLWKGAVDKRTGYGRIQINGTTGYAHRVSYETFAGPIPEGRELDHLCRNRACVNPDHLEPVTPQVNVLRGEAPGARARRRDMCLYGQHSYAEFGFVYRGRRACRECQRIYSALWREVPYAEAMRRKREGVPVVDLAAYYAEQAAA